MTPKSGNRFSDKIMPRIKGMRRRYYMVATAVGTISWA
jgi:hypothetical protein